MRFDGSYHISDGTIYLKKLRKMPHKELQELTSNIFTAGRNKRVYTDKEFGFPYLSNSDVVKNNPFESCNYNSKKYGFDKTALLKEGMILTGRVGAIGQTSYVSSELEEFQAMGSDNIIRIVAKDKSLSGYIYAFLVSRFGKTLLERLAAGGVQPYISEEMLKDIPIPILPEATQQKIHNLIVDAAALRVEANKLLREANIKILKYCKLSSLKNEDYEYFGNYTYGRSISTFKINIKEISAISINAFNYSKRISNLKDRIKTNSYLNLSDCLIDNNFFSTGSFKRLEVTSDKHIKLLNQSDIFNSRKIGKNISRAFVGNVRLVEYGEVLIAGVGTLGESETFCRVIFGNEEIEDQLISGEFIRMKVNEKIIPSGYLFAWLNSDYGFRLIRATHSGTKLCRPIPELLKQIPIPILENNRMHEIDFDVKSAHTKLFAALNKENQAIELIEKEIDQWQQ